MARKPATVIEVKSRTSPERRKAPFFQVFASSTTLQSGQKGQCASPEGTTRPIGGRLDGEALYYLARSYARLGDTAQALTLLERSVAIGFSCYQIFVSDQWLAPLANDRRFTAVVDRAREVSAAARHAYEGAGGRQLVG